jgi:hypothetical protein
VDVKKKRSPEKPITGGLKAAEAAASVLALCRKHGVSDAGAGVRDGVKQVPFVGARYAERRILILGESSWGTPSHISDSDYVNHWLEHPAFYRTWDRCENCRLFGKGATPKEDYKRDALYDQLTTMMLDWPRKVTDQARRDAWARIAFANFIPRPLVSRGKKDRPGDRDWAEAESHFRALLAELEPRPCACLVLYSPTRKLMSVAERILADAGVTAVGLAHPTMHPGKDKEFAAAKRRPARREAWRKVCAAAG